MDTKYTSAPSVAVVLITLSVVSFCLLAMNSSWVNGRQVLKSSAQEFFLPKQFTVDDNSWKEPSFTLRVQELSEPSDSYEVFEVHVNTNTAREEIEGSLQRFLLASGTSKTLSAEQAYELSRNIVQVMSSAEDMLVGHHENTTNNYWDYFLAANKMGEMVEQVKELSVEFEVLTGEPMSRFLADDNKLQSIVSRFSQQVNTNNYDLEARYVEN